MILVTEAFETTSLKKSSSRPQLPMVSESFLRINISGRSFIILKSTLLNGQFEATGFSRLEKLANSELCWDDKLSLADAYINNSSEFYFDRSPLLFESVLDFYRSGKLHCPPWMCKSAFVDELEFWGVDSKHLACCCSEKLGSRSSLRLNIPRSSFCRVSEGPDDPSQPTHSGLFVPLPMVEVVQTEDANDGNDQFKGVCSEKVRRALWNFVEEPNSSKTARIFSIISVCIVMLSVLDLILASIPELQVRRTGHKEAKPHPILVNVEIVCVAWFTVEYVARILLVPNRWRFFKTPLNIIDVLSILPFYLEVIINLSGLQVENLENVRGALLVLRILRVLRVARIFKLARYSGGLQSFGYTLKASYREIGMLLLFISITIILFSTTVYFLEKDVEGTLFISIPATFWWSIVTMTTVGYGDMVPKTLGGKLVASMTSVSGVIVLAFPITVIVENFNRFYKKGSELHDDDDVAPKVRVHGYGIV